MKISITVGRLRWVVHGWWKFGLLVLLSISCGDGEYGSGNSIVLAAGRRSASKKEWPPRREVEVPCRTEVAPEPITNLLLSKSRGSPM